MPSVPHFRFTVEGMMCQKNCASTVQKSLESVNGVNTVTVTFSMKLAEIWMNTKDLNTGCEQDLLNAIEDMGFDATCITRPVLTDFPSDYKFIVEGMMCQKNCGSTVQKALENVPGVRAAKVTFSTKLAEVWLETNDVVKNKNKVVSEVDLINAIEDIGFEAKCISSPSFLKDICTTLNNNNDDNNDADDHDDVTEKPDIELIVKGMLHPITCPETIKSLLLKIDGVVSVQVNYQEKLVSIYGFAEINNIIDILLKHGYYANNKNQKLKRLHNNERQKNKANNNNDYNNNSEIYNPLSNKSMDSLSNIIITYNDFLELKIQGMSCANCSKGIEKEISPLPGIQSIKIALLAEKAEIVYNADMISNEKIIHMIDAMGYEATVMMSKNKNEPTKKRYHFIVIGMSCTSCMNKIENSIYNTFSRKYIDDVNICLLTNKLVVTVKNNPYANKDNNNNNYYYNNKVVSSTIIEDTKSSDNNNTTSLTTAVTATTADHAPGPRDILDHIITLGYSCRFIASTNGSSDNATAGTVKNNYGVSYGSGNNVIDEENQESFCYSITPCSSTPVAEQTELQTWGKLLVIASILGIPVIFIHSIGHHIPPIEMMLMESNTLICHGALSIGQTLLICLNVPIQFIVGYKFYRSAWLGAMHYNFGMDFLIVLGTTITFVYSVLTVIYACVTPSIHSIKHLFFDASGMLFLFVTLGKFLEAYAKGKTVSAISSLLKLQPQQATIVEVNHQIKEISNRRRKSLQKGIINNNNNNTNTTDSDDNYSSSSSSSLLLSESTSSTVMTGPHAVTIASTMSTEVLRHVDIGLVQKGDILKVLPGARVPTDGVILSGSSALDESMITGESVPLLKSQNEFVFGSTINITNVLYMEVTAVHEENALSQIISLVESAQLNKAPIQAYADRMASLFTPFVVSIALITFFGWYICCIIEMVPSLWYEEEFGNPLLFSMLFGISVVVISCPCALGLATPTAIMVGTSLGATNGVLIKGGPAFEMAHKIKTIVFDKTGTLTLGKPNLTNIVVIHYDDDSNNGSYDNTNHINNNKMNNNNEETKGIDMSKMTTIADISRASSPPVSVISLTLKNKKKLRSYNFDFQDETVNNDDNNANNTGNNSSNVNEAVIQMIERDEVELEVIEKMKTRILMLAATVEQGSQHPLAQAVLNAAVKKDIPLYSLELDNNANTTINNSSSNNNPAIKGEQKSKGGGGGFKVVNGMGVECNTPEGLVLIGNRTFMESPPHSIIIDPVIDHAMWQIESQGKTAVCVALEKKILGILGISDTLKPDAIATIAALRLMNIDVWMVTGDNHTTAYAIAEELDIPQNRVMAGVLPAEKVSKIIQLQQHGNGNSSDNDNNTQTKSQQRRSGKDKSNKNNNSKNSNDYNTVPTTPRTIYDNNNNNSHRQYVAMVGDGINDSPALAQADLGIAVGAGTQVAIEAADMVLIRDCLSDVVVALDLAKFVFQRIRINFLWAVIYNFIAIPVAAGVWYPWTHMLVSPQYAGLAMAFSSTSVVISSLALRLYSRPTHLFASTNNSNNSTSTSLPLPKKKTPNVSGRSENGSTTSGGAVTAADVSTMMPQVILKRKGNLTASNVKRDATKLIVQPSANLNASSDYNQLPVEDTTGDGIQLLDARTMHSPV